MRRSRSCGRRMRRRRVRRSQSRSEPSAGRVKRRRKVRRRVRGTRRFHRGGGQGADSLSRSCSRSRSRCSRSNRSRSCGSSPGDRGHDGREGGSRNGREQKAEGDSEDEAKMRVWVADKDCARIIGKGGRTMRDAEARSRAKLKVQKEASLKEERYIDIIGDKDGQQAALQIVLELASFCRDDEGKVLKENGQVNGESDNAEKDKPVVLEVLSDEIGKIIGRKGETINSMEQESGARIELDKGSARLTVYGSKESQDKARELLLAEVSFAKEAGEEGEVLKGEAPARPPPPEAEGEKEGEEPDDADKPSDKPSVTRMWVKDAQAGRVIGHGGETVRKVMEKTGAEVKVQKSRDVKRGCQEREIVISGQKEQQEEALEMILADVTWARNEEGVLKTSPEEAAEPTKSEEKGRRRRKKGSRRRRRSNGKGSQSEDKAANQDTSEAVRGRGASADASARKGKKVGSWVCANCGGDHRTKDCSGSMKLGMPMAPSMPMGLPGMPMLPMGMPPPMLGMPMMGMPGLAMGMLPPFPGMGGVVSSSRRRRRSASASSSRRSSSRGDAAGSCSASGNAEESDRDQSSDRDDSDREAPAPGEDNAVDARSRSRSCSSRREKGERHKTETRHKKRRRSNSQSVQRTMAQDASPPATKAAKIDFSDL